MMCLLLLTVHVSNILTLAAGIIATVLVFRSFNRGRRGRTFSAIDVIID